MDDIAMIIIMVMAFDLLRSAHNRKVQLKFNLKGVHKTTAREGRGIEWLDKIMVQKLSLSLGLGCLGVIEAGKPVFGGRPVFSPFNRKSKPFNKYYIEVDDFNALNHTNEPILIC